MNFYVYVLRRPSGEPFYVGMGSGDRVLQHEKRALRERSYKASIIRSIWAQGLQVERAIVANCATDAEAKAVEVELIHAIGRKDLGSGPLANRTNGGDGVTGWSDEMRRAHGAATSLGMAPIVVRKKCREHMARLRANSSWAAARYAEIRAYWSRPENRTAQAKRIEQHFASESVRAAHSKRQRIVLSDPAVREKMRRAKLGKKQAPEVVAKRAAALRKPRKEGTGALIAAGKKAAAARRAGIREGQK